MSWTEQQARARVLVAKLGLDGHDRGVKVVARMLRDAGYEVIYMGLRQTPQTVAAAARDEDVDLIGLSMLSGAHLALAPAVVAQLKENDLDTPVLVGGIVPEQDIETLISSGISAVVGPGATSEELVEAVEAAIN